MEHLATTLAERNVATLRCQFHMKGRARPPAVAVAVVRAAVEAARRLR
jgi:hypothetical protein